MKINQIKAIKLIFLLSIVNSFIFVGYNPTGISKVIIGILLNISVVLLIIFYFKIFFKIKIHNYFKFLFILLGLWSLFTILKSFQLDKQVILSLFGSHNGGWVWITPLAVVFGFKIHIWKYLFKFFMKMMSIGIILTIMLFFIPLNSSGSVIYFFAFLPIFLLIYIYLPSNLKKLTLLSLISFLIISLILGSIRSNILLILLLAYFAIVEYYKSFKIKKIKKIFLTFFLVIFLLFGVSNIIKNISSDKHLTQDTRTFLVIEVFQDMSKLELLLGRGALGTYFSPYFEEWNKNYDNGDSSTRIGAEMGFLNMILKGGFIMVALYLMILIPVSYLGIFKSKNILTRIFGYLIFIQILMWTITYPQHYSSTELLLWMMVGSIITSRKIPNNNLFKITNKGLMF